MKPFLAVRLEQCHEQPGSLSSHVIAATAYDAKSEIHRLEQALLGIYRGAEKGSHAWLTAAAALDKLEDNEGSS